MTPLTDLPHEVVLNVVAHLDNNSIVNFLQAFPSLKKEAILITDHHFEDVQFAIDGVHRVYLPSECPHHTDLEMYDKSIHRHPIKMVDICYANKNMKHIVSESLKDHPSSDQLIDLDCCTFVHARVGRFSDSVMQAFNRMDTHAHGCHASMGFSRSILRSWNFCLRDHNSLKSIRCLSLDNISTLSNQTFNELTDLKITFALNEMSPSITGVVAPMLKTFSVSYNSQFPVIDIEVGGDVVTSTGGGIPLSQANISKSFELCYTGVPSVDQKQLSMALSKCNFGFMRTFHALHLSGVPSRAWNAFDLSNIHLLSWDVLHQFEIDETLTEIPLPYLRFIYVTVNACGVRLPKIICQFLYSINVRLMAPSIDIFDFMLSLGHYHRHMKIYRGLLARSCDVTQEIMTTEQWDQLLTSWIERIDSLELVGFALPLLQSKKAFMGNSYYIPYLKEAVLKPVMSKEDFEGGRIRIDGIQMGKRYHIFKLQPIFLDKETRTAASQTDVVFDIGLGKRLSWFWFSLRCSPVFKNYYLKGLKPLTGVEDLVENPSYRRFKTRIENGALDMEDMFPGISRFRGTFALPMRTSELWSAKMSIKHGIDQTWCMTSKEEIISRTIVGHSWCGRNIGLHRDSRYSKTALRLDYSPFYTVSSLTKSGTYGLGDYGTKGEFMAMGHLI